LDHGKEHHLPNVSVGDRAPGFELPDQQSQPWSLSGHLEAGPVMLVIKGYDAALGETVKLHREA